jgi:hypothetical protein
MGKEKGAELLYIPAYGLTNGRAEECRALYIPAYVPTNGRGEGIIASLHSDTSANQREGENTQSLSISTFLPFCYPVGEEKGARLHYIPAHLLTNRREKGLICSIHFYRQ